MGSPEPTTRPMPSSDPATVLSARATSFHVLRDRLQPRWNHKRYHIGGVIGEGSFGQVYIAIQEQEHVIQHAALKVLKRERLSPEAVVGLQEEARKLGSLSHRVFPSVLDFIYFHHRWALITEWIPGVPLSWLSQGKPAPLGVALEIIAELASGLQSLHHRHRDLGGSLAHCDVKPGNILISKYGCVHLVDFGSAQRCGGAHPLTSTGSFPYVAPEQLPGGAVPATDVFGLGVTFQDLLTSAVGADGPRTQEESQQFRQARLDRISQTVDADVVSLVRRMVDPKISGRPSSRDVEVACRRLHRKLGGTPLCEWAKETVESKDRPIKSGDLTGVEVTLEVCPSTLVTSVESLHVPPL